MKKPRIIIADEDYNYIIPLQLRFIEDMFEKIELEIITDPVYFASLFQNPQRVDVLIVSEGLYNSEIQKHDIKHGFVMCESSEPIDNLGSFLAIYKYTNIKEIYSVIQGKTSGIIHELSESNNDPQIILITSASGGVGKTTVAMGIASVLSNHMKHVLYINIDYLQTFHSLLINKMPINDNALYMQLATGDKDIFSKIKHLIRKEDFYYIPPFKGALISLGIQHSIGIEIAKQARLSREYDFVIIDADSVCDTDKINLFGIADKTIFVTEQNDASVFALNCLLESIELPDKDKVMLICNKFDSRKSNALLGLDLESRFFVNNYIEKMDDYWEQKDNKFSTCPGINKTAAMLI